MYEDLAQRDFIAPDGQLLIVRLAPRELATGGVHELLRTIVFETPDGVWIGSAPITSHCRLWALTRDELEGIYRQMIG